MKSPLLHALSALALSTGLMSAAQADSTQYVFLSPVGSTTTFAGTLGDTIAAAGDFTDIFVTFGAPSASDMNFSALAGSGITFTSITLNYWMDDTALPLNSASVDGSSIQASALDQISGTYQWVVKGTASVAGASFTGSILEDTNVAAPVPEPQSWALMLGGLGLVGLTLGRRRSRSGNAR